jgi:hypothetical protein
MNKGKSRVSAECEDEEEKTGRVVGGEVFY